MSRRGWVAGAVAASVVAGGVGVWRHGRAVKLANSAAAAAPSAETWQVGESRRFTAELHSLVRSDVSPILDVSLAGELTATALDTSSFGLQLRVRTLDLKTAPDQSDAVKNALELPFFATLNDRGLVVSIAFSAAEQASAGDVLAHGLLRSLVSGLQVNAPPSSAAKSWPSEEHDGVGFYRAEYQRVSPLSIAKNKLEYLKVEASRADVQASTVIDGSKENFDFEAGASLRGLKHATLAERTHVVASGPLPKLNAELSLGFTLAWQGQEAAARVAELAALRAGLTARALDDRSADRLATLDRAKVAGTTFSSLLAAIGKLDPRDAKARARLFVELSNHLRFEDANADEAARLIRAGDPRKALLIDALGSAGSEHAQSILQGLTADTHFDATDRRSALISLSSLKRPSESTIGFLRQLQTDPTYGRQASFGLGVAALNLQASNPTEAASITTELGQNATPSQPPAARVTALMALGNTGNDSALDTLEASVKDPDPSIRKTAVWAMRLVAGDRADRDIALVMVGDTEPSVRLSALDALGYRSPSPVLVYALQQLLQRETVVEVKAQAVRTALAWSSAAPVLQAELHRIKATDQSTQVQQTLRNFNG